MRIQLKVLNKEFYKDGKIIESSLEELGRGDIKRKHSLPNYATAGSAAIDLVCTEDVTIYPGETKMVPTGLAIWIGDEWRAGTPLAVSEFAGSYERLGVAGIILPRSGLGTKGLVLANTVGVIDSDYQGELMVSAWNRNRRDYEDDCTEGFEEHVLESNPPIRLKAGDRFAQLMFVPVVKAQFDIVEEFSNNTQRGTGGFGSTGK